MRHKLIERLVEEYGVKNLRFFIPMRPIHPVGFGMPIGISCSDDPTVRQECVIDERRYKALDGYKIELRAISDNDPQHFYGSETFYQMDFASLQEDQPDEYQIFVLEDEPATYRRLA